MTCLVACLGAGKGTWNEVKSVISAESWDKVFLVTNSFGKERFQANAEFIVIDDLQPAEAILPVIISQLKGRVNDTEIALNVSSGSGNVHMALLSALLKLGLGIRLVSFVNGKVEDLFYYV